MIFSLEILEKNIDECTSILILVIYWKKTGLLHTKITYLLTPWSRVLLEKLTGSAASQEIPRLTFHVPKTMSLFLLRDTSSRNTPPRRSE